MAPTALITGASQGIGKATALLFAQKGYDLVLAARQPDRLEEVAIAVRKSDRQVLTIPTDITDVQQVNALAEKALDFYGAIDVLINNAGICLTGPLENTSITDWQNIINTNVWGYIYTIQALLPHFLERAEGTIVNVGSFGGKVPLPHMTAYCTSKYAITGLTETMRLELEPKGIHVGIVQPSATNSNFLERAQFRGKDEQEASTRRQQMSDLLQTPVASKSEDVAQAIWDTVKHKRSEVVVGSATTLATAYRFFPGLMQWVMQRSVQNMK
jgi:short-subunit dehydrogenase